MTISEPVDNDIRRLAVSGQDKNIVVTAGAGTGKTTLLVSRMLHMLLGHTRFQNEESPILSIAAMTFTEKAASDLKIKLMEEFEKIAAVINGNATHEEKKRVEGFIADIRDTYHTTYSEIERRARKSIEDMDKALIGTIHSFAAHILRLYPIESGVAPGFIVDEGDVFDEMFDKEWGQWLETGLSLASPHSNIWKQVLRRTDTDSLKELAKRLAGFTIPTDSLTSQADNELCIHSLINPLLKKIHGIIALCEKHNNNLVLQLNAISEILDAVKKQGVCYLNNSEYDPDKNPSEAKSGWTAEGFATAKLLVKECHNLLKKLKNVDEPFIKTIIDLILPFTGCFRKKYLSQGHVSFDGLLTLTRDLLLNSKYRYVRDKLKSEFKAILVDEFQDTDPVQYEIVLFLAESLKSYSKDARNTVPEPGKLFIVGDPKQSIYAFRRADIEAYEQVVKQVCGHEETLKLRENFRSHAGIIEVVNQLFDGRIMVEQPGLQPCYIPIHANRQKKLHSQKVEIVLVSDREEEELKADNAREAEAEWIARWIAKHVANEAVEDTSAENDLCKLKYKDIALLLRAFTQVRPYVEAFKRYGIPYIVEGEKYFYTTQEVLDFINLLRIIENPHDTIALVGVLRSPIVGLTDREIYELKENHLLDYHKPISDEKLPPDLRIIVENFYNFLRKLHTHAGIIPVSQLISEIIDNTYVAEITACAWHGEQKLANILKLYQMACDMEQSEGVSLKTFIERIVTRIKEAREEGESPLSDETLDVVKILTIHKAKGLEFPVVVLGNLHGEVKKDNETSGPAVYDWSTSTTGIVIGTGNQQIRNLQSVLIEKKLNERSWEEEKRVLYVAMTRARERLILTGALKDNDKSYMGLITKALRATAGIELGDETFMNPGYRREEENSAPSPNPSHQGRGSNGELPSGEENKTEEGNKISDEDRTDVEKFPLPLRERDRIRGTLKGKFPLGNSEVFVEHFRFDGTHHPSRPAQAKKTDADWTLFAETWNKRREALTIATQTPLFTSPSAISREEAIPEEPPAVPGEFEKTTETSLMLRDFNYPPIIPPFTGGDRGASCRRHNLSCTAIVGSVCHIVLEGWDFQGTKKELGRLVEPAIKWALATEKIGDDPIIQQQFSPFTTMQIPDTASIKAEVLEILYNFFDSEAYKELQGAEILGREVPILLKWNGQIMRGTIDILYKTDGRIIIADYKTDQVTPSDIARHKEKYRQQKDVYVEAVKRCLKIDNPEFKLIFLRLGNAVSI